MYKTNLESVVLLVMGSRSGNGTTFGKSVEKDLYIQRDFPIILWEYDDECPATYSWKTGNGSGI
jgi:hypothetical protein